MLGLERESEAAPRRHDANTSIENMKSRLLCACLSVWAALAPTLHAEASGEQGSDVRAPPISCCQASRAGTDRSTAFVENVGQWPGWIAFAAKIDGAIIAIECDAIVVHSLSASGEAITSRRRLGFGDASSDVVVSGEGDLESRFSYFIGSDPSKWHRGARAFSGVRMQDLYPGVDLILRGNCGSLEYQIQAGPDADASSLSAIAEFEAEVDLIEGADGSARIDSTVVGSRLRSSAPGLLWSTYLGSALYNHTGDTAYGVATDDHGDVYVTGSTDGFDFPSTPGAYWHPGGAPAPQLIQDVFVTKFRGSDGMLLYSCLIGGSTTQERSQDIVVDASGRAVVVGSTFAPDFPTTPGAFDRVKNAINDTAFVIRLSADGTDLQYSTLLEGTQQADFAKALAVDVDRGTGSAIVGGYCGARFPTTFGAFDTSFNGGYDAFVARLNPSGTALEWATYFGGNNVDEIRDLDLDGVGRVTITGQTASTNMPTTPGAYDTTPIQAFDAGAFAARISADGSTLEWSTYLGDLGALGQGVAALPSGGTMVAGVTGGPGFPTTPGAYQADTGIGGGGFVTRFDAAGANLVYSTFLAGPNTDLIYAMSADTSGVCTVTGYTEGKFPMTPGAFDTIWNGTRNVFVSRLNPSGTKLLYSTYLGGLRSDAATEIAQSASGRICVAGSSDGPGYPTTSNAFSPNYNGGQSDAIVTNFDLFLRGIESTGDSTPGCRGALRMNTTEMPAAGARTFAFYCSGAPPNAKGALLLGAASLLSHDATGPRLALERSQGMVAIRVRSDGDGYVETAWPLPAGSIGKQITGQYFFQEIPVCASAPTLCTSNALRVTIQ